jgi:hypothetical protein
MVRIDAALTVVAVFLSRTPSRLIKKHVKDEPVLIQVETLQVIVQENATEQALRYKVIFN